MAGNKPDDLILQRYDDLLAEHGDTAKGAHWPNEQDCEKRHQVMLGLLPDIEAPSVLCDLGCGTGSLLDHLNAKGLNHISYIGADRSATALHYARQKHPSGKFIEVDINGDGTSIDQITCDWLVCNGVFTVKWQLTDAQMWNFLSDTLHRVWPVVRKGLAFNVMSKAVDWEREDLFHASMDEMAELLHSIAGRRIVFRSDYGLYEYTAYVYKNDH